MALQTNAPPRASDPPPCIGPPPVHRTAAAGSRVWPHAKPCAGARISLSGSTDASGLDEETRPLCWPGNSRRAKVKSDKITWLAFFPRSPFVCRAQGCHRIPASLVHCCFPSACLRNKTVLHSLTFATSEWWDRCPPSLQDWLSGKTMFAKGEAEMPGGLATAAGRSGARAASPSAGRTLQLRMPKLPGTTPPSATLWDHFGGLCPQPGSAGTVGARGRAPVPGPHRPLLPAWRGTGWMHCEQELSQHNDAS